VFHLFEEDAPHGLVAAEKDQGMTVWGPDGELETDEDIGAGKSNTARIVDYVGEKDGASSSWRGPRKSAAIICAELSLNGYQDWYLPSVEELEEMWRILKVNGLGGFAEVPYWSSSSDGDTEAMTFDFSILNEDSDDYFAGSSQRKSIHHVRAIRSFRGSDVMLNNKTDEATQKCAAPELSFSGQCVLCGKVLSILSRPLFRAGTLADGGELCYGCRGKTIFSVLRLTGKAIQTVRGLTTEYVRKNVDARKSIAHMMKEHMLAGGRPSQFPPKAKDT
jgi:hypothetical protein